jgi:hypothetical protein
VGRSGGLVSGERSQLPKSANRTVLIITNGDCAVSALEAAGFSGPLLPWRDVLHDGPVSACLSLEALSKERAQFVADAGWGRLGEIELAFRRRDAELIGARRQEEVVLWFEHDLYDQLQLLQLLDWFAESERQPGKLSLILVDRYLAEHSGDRLRESFASRSTVTPVQLALGRAAWAAFTAPAPTEVAAFLERDSSALPFLAGAFVRLLEEFPGIQDGLSRNERQILRLVDDGAIRPRDVFQRAQQLEEAPYLGDLSFLRYVRGMVQSKCPLLRESVQDGDRAVCLTDDGEAVLRGELDWVAASVIDKWIGGVHLYNADVWRWTGGGVTR